MFAHYERAKDVNGDYIKFKNQDIDTEKTDQNYNLAPDRGMSQMDYAKQRCSEVQCLKRKDLNVMCSWVVTAPKTLPKQDEREFFEQTYKFLENRYGAKNVISAHVHMDEISPHMHFSFVPVTYDKNKDIEKVNAKEKVSRADLQTFHKDLEKALERHFGREVGILNEATKEGDKCIEELKRGTAIEEVKQIKQEATVEASKIVSKAQEQAKIIESDVLPIKAEYNAYKAYLDQAQKDSEVSMMYPEYAEISKRGMFHKQEFVTVPKEMWEKKHVSANQVEALKREREELEETLKELKRSPAGERIRTLEGELRKSKGISQQLHKDLVEANKKLQALGEVFKNKPELAKAVSQAEKELKKTKMHSMERGR